MSSTGEEQKTDPIVEGQAKALLPAGVFYNPVQEFNRDLTITVISEFGKILRAERAEKEKKKAARLQKNGANVANADDISKECAKSETPENETSDNKTSLTHDESEDRIEVKTAYESDDRTAGVYYEDGMRILEGLAASGLRSVRFCKEIPGVRQVIGNDFSRDAVATMEKNIELNDVGHLMKASCADAAMLMYNASRDFSEMFDVIDLDPYGGPTRFLDGAVQAIKDGGLLCITCTDMAILCGNSSEKCFAAYGAMSIKSNACHEMALRIVLRTIDSYANRYARYIVPLLSVSVDFYCRVFVRVYTGAQKVKESASKSAMLYECTGCGAYHLQPLGKVVETVSASGQVHKKFTFSQGPVVDRLCEHCKQTHHIGGPLWSAPIHDMSFVESLITRARRDEDQFGTAKRIIGMMSLVSEELPDVPLYYIPDRLTGVIHSMCPGFLPFRSAILHAGYRVSMSHASINSIKTDAPMSVIWDILRCYTKTHSVNEKRIIEGTPCHAILSVKPKLQANFELHDKAEPESKRLGLLRFQQGKKDWGPKARGTNNSADQTEKRRQNQNKRAAKRARRDNPEAKVEQKKYYCGTLRRTGACSYGDDCRYNHDIPVDNKRSEAEASPQPVTDSASDLAMDTK